MADMNWGQLVKDAGDMSPIPVGKVDAVITKAEYKVSSNGKDMWACTFRVQNGPSAGKTFYNNFTLTKDSPNALRAFFINMQNLGISQQQIQGLGSDPNALTPLLLGKQAIVSITHREYQGSLRENVDRIEKHPAGPVGGSGGGSFSIPAASTATATAPAYASPPVPQPQPPVAPAPAPVPQPAQQYVDGQAFPGQVVPAPAQSAPPMPF